MDAPTILTPDQRLRVFVSSTMVELADERAAVRRAIERLYLVPVMFELGARPHPPRSLYLAYLQQSHIFVGIYGEQYGWIGPDMTVSGLEDELEHADALPRLLYVKQPADARDPRLSELLDRIRARADVSYKHFSTPDELEEHLAADLAVLITERFATAMSAPAADQPERPQLPAPVSDFVGRASEVAELMTLLTEDPSRIVTLTGPGGIGKTRLALQVAGRLRDSFTDGIAFATLSSRAPDELLEAMCAALGLTDLGQVPLADLLATHLADRELLLLLDSFEHMLPAAEALSDVVHRAPRIRVLVTSRVALRLSGEVEFPVPPLALPESAADDVAVITQSDAVQLFTRRLTAVSRDFVLDAEHAPTVADICRRLDGVPLALELVAARGNVLTVHEIAERLDRVLDLPARARDVPERQRTLRRTMDWSYEQLDPEAQRAFAELSAFTGSFSIAAAEAVCSGDGDVVDVLATLIDHSLLRSQLANGQARFSMLEPVREYARDQLEEAAREEVAARHAAYYHDIAIEAHEAMKGAMQQVAIARLDLDAADMSAARDWLAGHGRREEVADITWALWSYFWLRGALTACRRATSDALAAEGPLSRMKRGRLLAADAFMAVWQRDNNAAAVELLEAREIATAEHDGEVATMTSLMLSLALGGLGNEEQARKYGEEAVRLSVEQGDVWTEAYARTALCWLSVGYERLDTYAPMFAPMLATVHAVGDPLALALATELMAELHHHEDRAAEAAAEARDSLVMFRDLGMVYAGWSGLAVAALILEQVGDAEAAVRLHAAGEATMHSIDAEPWPPLAARQEKMLARLRAELPADRFERAWAEGSRWSYRDAVERTLPLLAALSDRVVQSA